MTPTYSELFETVLSTGWKVDSRHGPTREVLNQRVDFLAGELVRRKGINYKLGWMELLQLLGETYDPEALKHAAPKAQHGLFTPQMAYGLRIAGQFRTAADKLRMDPGSRQAVIFIGDRGDKMTNNLTCTLAMQFLLRDGYLHATVTMRSWDLVKGLAYDIMMFGGVTSMLARVLGVTAGRVTVNAASAHVYEADAAKTPTDSDECFYYSLQLQTLEQFKYWARGQIVAHNRSPELWLAGIPSGIYLDR